jgi:hypothetical protein
MQNATSMPDAWQMSSQSYKVLMNGPDIVFHTPHYLALPENH